MRLLRAVGLAVTTVLLIILAAGGAYTLYLLRLWRQVVRATDPFDPAEPL